MLNAYYYMKEANLKRLHTVWLKSYDISGKGKIMDSKKIRDCQIAGGGKAGKVGR